MHPSNIIATNILIIIFNLFPILTTATWPKRGLAFNNPPTYVHNWNGTGSQVNWAYNWDSYMDPTFPLFMEFVPMLWSNSTDLTRKWFGNVNDALSRGSGHLLSFNEPDHADQAHMSAQDAVNAYLQYMMPFARLASLGAPAVTNGEDGLKWLGQFLTLCTGCKIDFVPIHWYGAANDAEGFCRYVEAAHGAAGRREIWITEFNASGSVDEQATFLRRVMRWMDNQPYIFRYAWFWCKPEPNTPKGSLVLENGDPSYLGRVFAYTECA